MPQRGKGKKMDPNFVSSQKWEIQYIADKFDVQSGMVISAKRECGKSRKKIYAYLKSIQEIPTKPRTTPKPKPPRQSIKKSKY